MHLVTGGDQVDVSLPVLLEGWAIAVMTPAVSFNDHLLLRPEEVDEVALGQDVDERGRKFNLPAKGEEVDLGDRFRLQRLRFDFEDNPPKLADPLAPTPARDDATQSPPS